MACYGWSLGRRRCQVGRSRFVYQTAQLSSDSRPDTTLRTTCHRIKSVRNRPIRIADCAPLRKNHPRPRIFATRPMQTIPSVTRGLFFDTTSKKRSTASVQRRTWSRQSRRLSLSVSSVDIRSLPASRRRRHRQPIDHRRVTTLL